MRYYNDNHYCSVCGALLDEVHLEFEDYYIHDDAQCIDKFIKTHSTQYPYGIEFFENFFISYELVLIYMYNNSKYVYYKSKEE